MKSWSVADFVKLQREDLFLLRVIEWIENNDRPKQIDLCGEPVELRTYCALWKALSIQEGILFRTENKRDHCIALNIIALKLLQDRENNYPPSA